MTTGTLDSNNQNAMGEILHLTDETLLTLYVIGGEGSHKNHHTGVQISPDGSAWVALEKTIKGAGCITFECVARQARVFVEEPERTESSIIYFLIAR